MSDPEYCGKLNASGLYELLLRAGYDRRDAQESANQRGFARLSAGMEV